jgi:hypothetical protein
MRQTAVDYLIERFLSGDENIMQVMIKAKLMEKEQITDAHIEGQRVFDKHDHTQWTTDQAEQYYKETYETKTIK